MQVDIDSLTVSIAESTDRQSHRSECRQRMHDESAGGVSRAAVGQRDYTKVTHEFFFMEFKKTKNNRLDFGEQLNPNPDPGMT